MKAVCVGHSTYDITLSVDSFPVENTKNHITKYTECGGGPASNAAYLLAKWGMDTTIASVIGNDDNGAKIMKDFVEIGADTRFLERHDGVDTSTSYIITNKENGSRTIITAKKDKVRKLNQELKIDADVILIDGEHPESAEELLKYNGKNKLTVMDAGRLNHDTRFLGKMVEYLVCSKDFAQNFIGKEISADDIEGLIETHKALTEFFNNTVIITLEDKGSFLFIDGAYEIIPTIKVTAVDSTGAGDIYHGAFTYFIAHNYPLRDAIRYASITAGISVTKVGSRNSIPTIEEVINYDKLI